MFFYLVSPSRHTKCCASPHPVPPSVHAKDKFTHETGAQSRLHLFLCLSVCVCVCDRQTHGGGGGLAGLFLTVGARRSIGDTQQGGERCEGWSLEIVCFLSSSFSLKFYLFLYLFFLSSLSLVLKNVKGKSDGKRQPTAKKGFVCCCEWS